MGTVDIKDCEPKQYARGDNDFYRELGEKAYSAFTVSAAQVKATLVRDKPNFIGTYICDDGPVDLFLTARQAKTKPLDALTEAAIDYIKMGGGKGREEIIKMLRDGWVDSQGDSHRGASHDS